ncbi:MAG: response regulator [Methylobacterium sp.]
MTDIFLHQQLDAWTNEGGRGRPIPVPHTPLNILVIEDDAMIAMLYSELLTQIGHQVCGLARAENEAVAMARRLLPDVIIADLGLREGSGLGAMERIRHRRDVPHIFITGGDLQLRDARGAAGLLRKPFSEDQLVAAIARVTAEAGLDPEH